jgi:hypothetical protein
MIVRIHGALWLASFSSIFVWYYSLSFC